MTNDNNEYLTKIQRKSDDYVKNQSGYIDYQLRKLKVIRDTLDDMWESAVKYNDAEMAKQISDADLKLTIEILETLNERTNLNK